MMPLPPASEAYRVLAILQKSIMVAYEPWIGSSDAARESCSWIGTYLMRDMLKRCSDKRHEFTIETRSDDREVIKLREEHALTLAYCLGSVLGRA